MPLAECDRIPLPTARERVGSDGGVAGLDPNAGMLAVAERVAPGIAWTEGVAEAIPSESLLLILSLFVGLILMLPWLVLAWRLPDPVGRDEPTPA